MFPPGTAPCTVLDAFCGVGGNSIQFALLPTVTRVIALDTSLSALCCARHNAMLYGVAHKITFINEDFFSTTTSHPIPPVSAVFLSPPWGGPTYRDDGVFNLDTMKPYSAREIVRRARELARDVAVYLPRTSDLNQVLELREREEEEVEVVHYCLGRRSKALTVYLGGLNERVRELDRKSVV